MSSGTLVAVSKVLTTSPFLICLRTRRDPARLYCICLDGWHGCLVGQHHNTRSLWEKIVFFNFEKWRRCVESLLVSIFSLWFIEMATPVYAGLRNTVGIMSGCRYVSDCRSRGRRFDPGLLPYFRRDHRSWNNFYGHSPYFGWFKKVCCHLQAKVCARSTG